MKEKKALNLHTERGLFAARDFGGTGRDVLFVHGTGHNLEVWTPLAEQMKGAFRMAAFDSRGNGQTPLDSTDPEQYWRDISWVSTALGLTRPLLVGHSAGGYAITAYAASGGDCAGLVILDGFVLDDRQTPEEAKAWAMPRQQLWDMFRYGWVTGKQEMEDYVAQVCRQAPGDWLNDGLGARLVDAFTRRSFLEKNGSFIRRPTMEELAVVGRCDPTAPIYPALDVYDRIAVPMGFVLAGKGLYANRRRDVQSIVAQGKNRELVEIDSGHNVHMQEPEAVGAFIKRCFGPGTPTR